MSTYYYLLIPEDKLLIYIGSSLMEEFIEETADKLSTLQEVDSECLYKELTEYTMKDLMDLLKLAENGELLQLLQQEPAAMLYYYFKYIQNKDVKIVSEYDEEYKKAIKKKFKVIDINYN